MKLSDLKAHVANNKAEIQCCGSESVEVIDSQLIDQVGGGKISIPIWGRWSMAFGADPIPE